MVDRAKLLERLMATFLDELDDHVQTLNGGILALEKGLDDEGRKHHLTEMFRAAHSLKGAARAVDQFSIEQLCHTLEDVLDEIRKGNLESTAALSTLMLKTADALGMAGRCLRAKEPVNEAQLDQFRAAVKSATAGEPAELPLTEASPETPARTPDTDDPAAAEPQPEGDTNRPSDQTQVDLVQPNGGPAPSMQTERQTKRLSSTVRVAEEKLDHLLAKTGELLVVRQRVDTHSAGIETVLHSVMEWKNEWQNTQRSLIRTLKRNGERSAGWSSQSATLLATVEGYGDRLRELEKSLELLRQQMLGDARQLNAVGASVQDEVHHIRMVPFEEACAGLERAVRDIATSIGKDVELLLEGGEIEVDRSVITGLADPLKHLVRNAVDHGVETPTERRAVGKPPIARVIVAVSLRGSQVQLVVADDGRGIQFDKIRDRLRKRGLPVPSDDRELVDSIMQPGFSTADFVTDLSGRGVGMDVVKSQIERLRGTIDISTEPGLGTRFTLRVPLTLTTINAVLVELDGQPFLLPSSNVRKLVRFHPSDLRRVQGRDTLPLGGSPLPVASLAELLGRVATVKASETGQLTGVVAATGDLEGVLLVDDVTSEREVVVKNLGPRIHRLPHVSGAALLQSGEIALLLNAANVIRTLAAMGRSTANAIVDAEVVTNQVARRVLVVDDSVTTRTLIRSILEAAGYDVESAVDGRDAWERMQAAQSGFEVIVADVDMPRMDGFELTETIRSSQRYEKTPVVLVTSRDTDEDKSRGVRAGASAYLVKSQFDQTNILDTIQQLI